MKLEYSGSRGIKENIHPWRAMNFLDDEINEEGAAKTRFEEETYVADQAGPQGGGVHEDLNANDANRHVGDARVNGNANGERRPRERGRECERGVGGAESRRSSGGRKPKGRSM